VAAASAAASTTGKPDRDVRSPAAALPADAAARAAA
jgi:hypothetical protein